MPETSEILINWIEQGLERQGLSQKGLARHLGLSHSQVSRLLSRQRKLQIDEIDKISLYLGTQPPTVSDQTASEIAVDDDNLVCREIWLHSKADAMLLSLVGTIYGDTLDEVISNVVYDHLKLMARDGLVAWRR